MKVDVLATFKRTDALHECVWWEVSGSQVIPDTSIGYSAGISRMKTAAGRLP